MSLGVLGGFLEYIESRASADQSLSVELPHATPAPVQPRFRLATHAAELASQSSTQSALLPTPIVSAQSVWIYERETDSLLYESNSQTATLVASLAKLMTGLVAADLYALDQPIQVGSAAAAVGNRAKFLPSDMFSVYDLLQAMLIFSANDAAEALAAGTGDTEAFVTAMNRKAQSLELAHTHFANPSGLDDAQQYSSAADIGVITDHFLDNPALAEIVRRPTVTLRELNTGRLDTVYSTNELLYRDARYQGVKTGTTLLAGESLVVRYKDPNYDLGPVDLIIVVLGSQDRFADAQALRNWIERSLVLPAVSSIP